MFKQSKLLAFIAVSMLANSCTHVDLKRDTAEGQEIREVLESTVKIDVSVKGERINVLSSTETPPADGTPVQIGWMGSGVVVKNNISKGQSLIMTAFHVAHADKKFLSADEDGIFIFKTTSVEITVETLDGTTCRAEEVVGEKEKDIAVIKAFCIAGKEAQLADEMPPVGGEIMVSGAPLGYHPKNLFIVSEGKYMGIDQDTDESIVTAATVGGFSGSAVYHNGKIIGLLSKRTVRYEHISICTNLQSMKDILRVAETVASAEGSLVFYSK